MAPADATTQPRIHGLIGKQTAYLEPQECAHPFRSARLEGFTLRGFGPGKKLVVESKPTDLRKGWNLLTVPVEGGRRSFLIYGGEAPNTGGKYGKTDK